MKIEVFSRKPLLGSRKCYFRIVAQNGQVVAQSEGYSRRIDCLKTAHSLRDNLGRAEIADVKGE